MRATKLRYVPNAGIVPPFASCRSADRDVDSVDPVSIHLENGELNAVESHRVSLMWHLSGNGHEETSDRAVGPLGHRSVDLIREVLNRQSPVGDPVFGTDTYDGR